ncbi:hypothetical protein MMC10_008043 [Thelotrema lepadinum]|nr:hypothetical protein [Thelotrema lepadinum]
MGTTPAETFPFTSLPPEPQRQVLMHTGLLIPFRRIRSLDLVLNYKELRDWGALRSSKSNIHVPAEWEEFAVILDARPNLGNLSLSIDAASAHMPEDCLLLDGESYSSLPDLYKAIVKPFAARPRFRELRNFFVFWPLFQSCEAETEKAVMGMDYDSEARGKILYSNREWRLPHGREAGEFDGNADLDQNWLDNDIDCWAGFD